MLPGRAGRLLEALRLAERARRIAEETQDPKLRSWLAMESEAHMYRGAWWETTQVAQEHLPFAWSVGNWAVVLWSSAFATVAEIKLGNLDHADALIGKALVEAAPPAGDDFPRIYPQIALGQLRLAQGANDLAMVAAKQAMSHTERAMLPQLELGAAHRMLGEAHQAGRQLRRGGPAFRGEPVHLANDSIAPGIGAEPDGIRPP